MASSAEVKVGSLSLISLGPGDLQQMTAAARSALLTAETVIGYRVYIDLVASLLGPEQEIIRSPIGAELKRARQAITLAAAGRRVALLSSGDIGIYAMASPVFELLQQEQLSEPDIKVYPGVSAIQAAAARLGAPLGHDFCTISLSDLLTPWPVIERRLFAAAWGDFVIGFYNPRSQKRDWQLQRALEILLAHRDGSTPAAVVRNVTRLDETVTVVRLADLDPGRVDMFSLVLVGNSQTVINKQRMVTPRGYTDKGDGQGQASEAPETGREPPVSDSGSRAYPINLIHMKGSPAVVVGGGPVGQRKTESLLASEAMVTLISPEATARLQALAGAGRIRWEQRGYRSSDLLGARLACAATNQRAVNAQIALDARQFGLLCNVADRPEEGTFHVPARLQRDELLITVSTAGTNPRRARQLRDQIAGWIEEQDDCGSDT